MSRSEPREAFRCLPVAIGYTIFLCVLLLMPFDFNRHLAATHAFFWNAEPAMARRLPDLVLNVAIFVPVGFLFHADLRERGVPLAVSVPAVLLGATALTLTIESLQAMLPLRHSSIVDAASNATGAVVGVALSLRSRRNPSALNAGDASR